MFFPCYFQDFLKISRNNFPFFHVAWTHIDSLISLVAGDSDLKFTEPLFSSFERNLPRPQIHWLKSEERNLPTALFSHT